MTRKALQLVRLVLLLVAASSLGLHYALVQMVGWVNMTVEYSQTAPFSEALAMTFDGDHPCELCKLVEKELGNAEQDERRTPENKAEQQLPPVVCWVDGLQLLRLSPAPLPLVRWDDRARFRRERPPLLPPRMA
jgi:hypothetical protein